MTKGKGREEIGKQLNFIEGYTDKHFKHKKEVDKKLGAFLKGKV